MHVVQLLAGTGQGGADRVAIALGRGLQAAGHRVTFGVAPYFLRNRPRVGVEHECWEIDRFRGLPWRSLREFNRKAAQADLVVTHDSGARHFGIYAKLTGLRPPVWFYRHCISGTTRFGGVQLHRLVTRHHVAVSDIIARSLIDSGYPDRQVTRIHGAIDLAPFLRPDRDRVEALRDSLLGGLPDGTIVVGMVGRLHLGREWRPDVPDFKGYDVLFRALSGASFPWRVLALGPGSEQEFDAVRRIARHNGADPSGILFGGFVDDPSAHVALMDVNVLPSRNEGLGLTVIESMAAGVPTLGSRSGGIKEIIEDETSGLLFEEGNARALRAALERVVVSPDLRRTLSEGGRHRARTVFDAPVMVSAFETLMYRELGRSPGAVR